MYIFHDLSLPIVESFLFYFGLGDTDKFKVRMSLKLGKCQAKTKIMKPNDQGFMRKDKPY